MEKFDVLLAVVLLLGTAFYSVYMCQYAMNFTAKSNYKVT